MVQKGKGQPKQKRSIATKNKIKQTARELFSERGYYAVTSNNIASAAGVPIGSFYNYFGNKKGLLLELVKDFNERFHAGTIDEVDTLADKFNTPEGILSHIEMLLTRFLLSPQLSDPFYKIIHALQFTESDVLVLSQQIRDRELDFLFEVLKKIDQSYPIANIPLSAKMIHTTAENVALYIHHLGSDFEQQELISETAQMIYRYLKLPV